MSSNNNARMPGSYADDIAAPGTNSYTSNTAAPGSYTDNTVAPSPYANNTTTHGQITQPTPSMRGGTNAGAGVGCKMEGMVSTLHGAGEQIRGQFNMAIDSAMRDREGQARNAAVIERGREEVATGRILPSEDKRHYAHETYSPVAGAGTMARTGTTTGMGAGTGGLRRGSLTEGSYGEPGPTNAHTHPGPQHTGGGPAIGGGHYVADETRTRRSSRGY